MLSHRLLAVAIILSALVFFSFAHCNAQEPEFQLQRAIKYLEGLNSNCFVVGDFQYLNVSANKARERVEPRILLNIAPSPGLDNQLMISAVFHTGTSIRIGPPGFPAHQPFAKESRFEVVVKSGSNWYVGDAEDLSMLDIRLIDRNRSNYENVVTQFSKQDRIEFASLPLMTYFSLGSGDCSIDVVKQSYDPKNPNCFVYHSLDSKVGEGNTAGIWNRRNNNALVRILFSSDYDNMPVQFEYYSRDVNIPYKEGGELGKLVYRTNTKWQIQNGATLPQKIELEVFAGDKQKRQFARVDCVWSTNVNQDLISADTTLTPFAEGSPIYEELRRLIEELNSVLESASTR